MFLFVSGLFSLYILFPFSSRPSPGLAYTCIAHFSSCSLSGNDQGGVGSPPGSGRVKSPPAWKFDYLERVLAAFVSRSHLLHSMSLEPREREAADIKIKTNRGGNEADKTVQGSHLRVNRVGIWRGHWMEMGHSWPGSTSEQGDRLYMAPTLIRKTKPCRVSISMNFYGWCTGWG